MADKEQEQAKFIKEQANKILGLLISISPAPGAVKSAYKLSGETTKALSLTESTLGTGKLSASDANLNRLATISQRLVSELSALDRKDENWWIEASGANLLSKGESTRALKHLVEQQAKLKALREACEGLKTLAAVAFANTVANVKGLAKLYIPSIPMIDGMVTKDIQRDFDVCIRLINSILKKVAVAAGVVADMMKSIDRFLLLVHSQDKRHALKPAGP